MARLTQEQILTVLSGLGMVAPFSVGIDLTIEDTKNLKFKAEALIMDNNGVSTHIVPSTDQGVNRLFPDVDTAIKWFNTAMGSMGALSLNIVPEDLAKIAIVEKLPNDIVAFNAALKQKRIAKKVTIDATLVAANAVVAAAEANGWHLNTATPAQAARYAEINEQKTAVLAHQTWLAAEIVRLTA